MSKFPFKGPTSAKKKKQGKSKKSYANNIIVSEFDQESCHMGVIFQNFSEWEARITDVKNDSIIHCKAKGFKIKFVGPGTPVVFAYNSSKSGEILCYYTNDYVDSLCEHFKVNKEKVKKLCGLLTTVTGENNDSEIHFESASASASAASGTIMVPAKSTKAKNTSDSNSDSLEPNPNHIQSSEEDDELVLNDDEVSEMTEKIGEIDINYCKSREHKKKSSQILKTARFLKQKNSNFF